MKKQSQLGLVIEGSATSSAVLRASKLSDELGPVKSGSLRVARRLSNTLRAGYAVEEYLDLQAARLIFLRLPDSEVGRIVKEICVSGLVVEDMSFVLCESWLASNVLDPLAEQGASTASVMSLPTTLRDWFVVEGKTKAVRQTRRFLERSGGRTDELKTGSKDLLFAAQLLLTAVPLSTLTIAQHALRTSGFSGNNLSALLEQTMVKMIKDFLRGARTVSPGPLNECASAISDALLKKLENNDPPTAAYVTAQMQLAKEVAAIVKGSK